MTNVGHKVQPETKIMSCLLIDQQPQKKKGNNNSCTEIQKPK